ncbi:Vegetative incompatibility HET-E-1 [Fusarium agapanthi]|uniref:Vegetative incompatibility HET-E-1 n=1 Tax=Fusarium agapanthi TaxID=1803897 RepID=A0A9P5E638_9HYPO|nr:Vegetative incompatibility HET-E-1 [Fusarium agapanthi]
MRFLNVKTLKLHIFDDASAYPPYAILSHCWYSSELELTFKDFEDLSQHASKPGYSKIVSACHAAVTQGYDWLWADNVCINKEDEVEKEESTKNLYSMFLKAGSAKTTDQKKTKHIPIFRPTLPESEVLSGRADQSIDRGLLQKKRSKL